MYWQIYWVSPPHQKSTLKGKYGPKCDLRCLHIEEYMIKKYNMFLYFVVVDAVVCCLDSFQD